MTEHDSTSDSTVDPVPPGPVSRRRRIRGLLVGGAVVLAVVGTVTGIRLTGSGSTPQATPPTAQRPSREAQVYDLYGMTLAQAEQHLGVSGGKNAAGVRLDPVAVPAGQVIEGVPGAELTVTAACVAPANTPTGNDLGRINVAVTPTAALTDELRQRVRDRSFTAELTSVAGCAWWGGAFTVYTD